MELTEKQIHKLYQSYKNTAAFCARKKKFSNCLTYIEAAAFTAYNFYLGFKDDELEKIVINVSKTLKQKEWILKNEDGYIFYDSYSIDNAGLTQQYLNALMTMNVDIVYITEKNNFLSTESTIKTSLLNYNKAVIIRIPNINNRIKKSQFIYDTICEIGFKNLLIHTGPKASCAVTAFYALPKEILKYKINLTDHTFWLGASAFDYSFEFRNYGCAISHRGRNVELDKIFLLPFYPIMNQNKFIGYPKEAEGKIVIFSGGAYYKIYDEDDIFFKLSKSILDKCPNTIILFAGQGNKEALVQKLVQYNLQDRLLLIGQRQDITEVFKNCYIYLNTYPFAGGLMCQYAAQLNKPIISFSKGKTSRAEDFVCQNSYFEITDYSIEDIVAKVKRLCEDPDYYKQYSNEITNCTITKSKFDILFKETILKKQTQVPLNITNIDYHNASLSIKDKINYENSEKWFQRIIIKRFGIKSLWICPQFLFDSILLLIKENRIITVMYNKLFRKK